ncbi:MAG: ribonuclease D, partial [Candidatus Aminicenantes bacterium]|nr:ribonuclease D [Candidatus Aminicenantes bacterium]
ALTARYLGRRLVKTAQKTNWAQSQLSRKQQVYAAADAWVCLQVYPHLVADATDYRKFIEEEEEE